MNATIYPSDSTLQDYGDRIMKLCEALDQEDIVLVCAGITATIAATSSTNLLQAKAFVADTSMIMMDMVERLNDKGHIT